MLQTCNGISSQHKFFFGSFYMFIDKFCSNVTLKKLLYYIIFCIYSITSTFKNSSFCSFCNIGLKLANKINK